MAVLGGKEKFLLIDHLGKLALKRVSNDWKGVSRGRTLKKGNEMRPTEMASFGNLS